MSVERTRAHQLRTIWGTARAIGLDDEMLHHLNLQVNKIDSISALDGAGLERLIKQLFLKARQVKGRKKKTARPGNVMSLMSLEQQTMIVDLVRRLGWNEVRYRGFCLKVVKKPEPRTIYEASKIIEAFKSMIRRDYGAATNVPLSGTIPECEPKSATSNSQVNPPLEPSSTTPSKVVPFRSHSGHNTSSSTH
jgi:hypothetical protein